MATLTIKTLAGRASYVPSPANVGLIDLPAGTVLVDSGNDAEGGRRLVKLLADTGRKAAAVLLTHSNADHMGGAAFAASRTGSPVYASRMEAAFCADPFLEPSFLWGGYPPVELRGKFFVAPSCAAAVLAPGELDGNLAGIVAVPLGGHYFGQLGFLCDGVLFAGDALFGEASLAKHPIFFVYDVAAFLDSLDRIVALAPLIVLPSHGEPTQDVASLAAANRAAVLRTAEAVLDACGPGGLKPGGLKSGGLKSGGRTAEEILSSVAERFGIVLDWAQYALVGSTVRSYLVWLRDSGKATAEFSSSRLLWRQAF